MRNLEVVSNKKVRYFDVIINKSCRDKHYTLITEFIDEGFYYTSLRSGPYIKDFKLVKNYSRFIFLLSDEAVNGESPADRYIQKMGI